MRKVAVLMALAAALAGCGLGWPWKPQSDPKAAAALQDAEPLIAECRQHFLRELAGASVRFDSGPTVVNDGSTTTIRLEADPTAEAINSRVYSCEFSQGKLVSNGPVR